MDIHSGPQFTSDDIVRISQNSELTSWSPSLGALIICQTYLNEKLLFPDNEMTRTRSPSTWPISAHGVQHPVKGQLIHSHAADTINLVHV